MLVRSPSNPDEGAWSRRVYGMPSMRQTCTEFEIVYPVINPIPPFQPYDVCRIKKTGTICVVTEVNLNTSQTHDEHQWSFSIEKFDKKAPDHNAWYGIDELEYMNNIFEIIADSSMHPFSSSRFNMRLQRR